MRAKQKVRQLAQDTFGYESLRPGQETAIQSVLNGCDTLVVMPTGSGKSAIYQIAGQFIPGPTVVVSPMIALQRDQVQSIEQQDAGGAVLVNSTIGADEREDTLRRVKAGEVEFLFLAPEQFNREDALDSLRAAKPSLFVIDEAHCISEWGHDFRPDYLKLGGVIEALGHPTILALTATASPLVRDEIISRLEMRNPHVVVQGFNRPNIWMGVERYDDAVSKKRALLERVEQAEKPGIIYAATRKHAEQIAAELRERDVRAVAYHAGMKSQEREQVQESFMTAEGDAEVIVATTAFGMGVDKPNVRFVFHYDISDSVDAYYQEIGRGGRDGEPAKAVLFYRPEDLGVQKFLTGSGQMEAAQVERVAELVTRHDGPVEFGALLEESRLSQSHLTTALMRLEDIGVVESLSTGELVSNPEFESGSSALVEAAQEAVRAHGEHKEFQKSRLEMMRGYAELRNCRRDYLLNYFGEDIASPCGYCDNCDAGLSSIEIAEQSANDGEQPFPLNSQVSHKSWGDGTVMRYDNDKIVVLFETVGYKTLALDFATQNHLLQPTLPVQG